MSDSKKEILILHGPNLNLLGSREKEIYGSFSSEDILSELKQEFPDFKFSYYQSNVEGELVNALHEASSRGIFGVAFNAAAYTHTSVALADAVAAIDVPVIEVHISNVHSREDYRHVSYMAGKCKGVISGFGKSSYKLAVLALLEA